MTVTVGSAGNDVDFHRCNGFVVDRRLQNTTDRLACSQLLTHHEDLSSQGPDTLRFPLCDDQDMGDLTADPCWWSSDVVKPTTKPPYVEPSGRSKSSAASDIDTVRRLTNGIA